MNKKIIKLIFISYPIIRTIWSNPATGICCTLGNTNSIKKSTPYNIPFPTVFIGVTIRSMENINILISYSSSVIYLNFIISYYLWYSYAPRPIKSRFGSVSSFSRINTFTTRFTITGINT